MRNEALRRLDGLLGEWTVTLSDAWFLDPPREVHGSATVEWLGDAFVVLRSTLDGHPAWDYVIGHHDPHGEYRLLYHDERGVCRVFAMTYGDDGTWALTREDPDMHQRFLGRVTDGRVEGRWEASEDAGATWRKDFDVTMTRA